MKVYGIKNCDTVKKALKWLDEHHVRYEFHDFKKQGISLEKLQEWASGLGWEALINKRGTTWKKLDRETQDSITTPEAAFKLLQDKTSIIKRPVIEDDHVLLSGFDEVAYEEKLS